MPIFGSKTKDSLGKQYIVTKAFMTKGFYGINRLGVMRITTKCLLPNMILSVEASANQNVNHKEKIGLKNNQVFALVRTNKDEPSDELKELITSGNAKGAISKFAQECIIHWKTIVLNDKDFSNLKEISLEEYRRIRSLGPKAYYPNKKA